jgi:hypothetical protein
VKERIMKRVILVVDFEDRDGNIDDLTDAATWVELALGEQADRVTAFRTAADAQLDEAEKIGAFMVPATPLV